MSRARDTAGIIQYNNLTIDSNNAVGIGSSMPDTKFDINGGLRVTGIGTFENDVQIADKIVHTGDTDTAIRFPAADTFTVETGGIEALRVTGAQRIGINTDDPTRAFEVYDDTNAIINLKSTTQSSVIFSDHDDINIGMLIYEHSSDSMQFRVNDAERVRIDSSGNVGIGTDNPTSRLHLSDSSGALIVNRETDAVNQINFRTLNAHRGSIGANSAACFTVYDSSSAEKLRVTSGGEVIVNGTAAGSNAQFEVQSTTGSIASATLRVSGEKTTTGAINTGSTIILAGHDGGNSRDFASFFAGKENGTGSNFDAYLAFGTRSNGNTLAERLRITSAGNVSIQNDSGKFTCGASDDLEIYHNGTFSYIDSKSTQLRIETDAIRLRTDSGETMIEGDANADVKIYYDNGKRIQTTSDGVDFFGVGSIKVPVGTTAQRNASPTAGDFRYNSETGGFEGYTTEWGAIAGSGGGGITTTASAPSANTIVYLDLGAAQYHELALSAGITTISCSNGTVGDSHVVVINQPSSGIATVGFDTYFEFPSGAAPAMSEGSSKVDMVSFVVKKAAGAGGTELLASAGINYQ